MSRLLPSTLTAIYFEVSGGEGGAYLLIYMLMGRSGSSDSRKRSCAVTRDAICSVIGPCMKIIRSCQDWVVCTEAQGRAQNVDFITSSSHE